MDKKNQLLELLEESHQNEARFIANLSEEERASRGTDQDWAVKDEIAHIAAWKAISSERILAFMANEEPTNYDDTDAVNNDLYHQYKEKPWQEILDFHELSFRELSEHVRLISEEDLLDGQRYEWLRGLSLWRRTVHNGYFHPQGHMAFYFSHNGDKERGNLLMEEITNTLRDLDEQPLWQGRALYNLACYYSLIGEIDMAVKRLNEAFSLNPDMLEWSKSDSDLDNIRDEPDYIAWISEIQEKE